MAENRNRKLYILTGASKGLGRAVKEILAADSRASIITIGRTATTRYPHANVYPIQADLAGEPHYYTRTLSLAMHGHHMAGQVYHEYYLINCAATAEGSAHEILSVNLAAPAELCQAFVALTGDYGYARRRILNVTSGFAALADGKHWAYAASKAGLEHMTRCLRLRWGDYGVDLFSPGPMDTAMGTRGAARPEDVAPKLLDYLHSFQFGNEAPQRPTPPPSRQIREDGKVMR